ncbi:MAG: pectinesterase family protein, partial [Candidatus Bipolaricaulota bacterium]|nr:pectinesterase family protein [Candidatus Bipolaricaulota bacterium]
MRTAWRCALLVLFLPCAIASSARSAQWIVAQDGSGAFRSIQGAIDASTYGDIVYVSPGVYDEHVVLKDGVRVVGAGASSTVVRHAYGFDEVVRIRNMGSGSLERVTIERLASVLPGPAVYADSAAASLIDCTIQNGQSAGVEAVGTACTLTLERVSITGNVGHGFYVHDGAQAVLQDSRIEENTGSGLVIGAASAVRVSGTTISDNGRCGVALEGDADLDMESSTIRRQPEWAILALGAARVRLLDVALADNGIGGLELAGTTDAVVTDAVVSGGGDGVVVAGSARLEATGLRVSDVVGDGLLLAEQSTLEASQIEIVAASRDGVILSTAGDVSIVESTIVENGGDGLLVRAGRPRVWQTILAYNRGAGVRLDASQSPPPAADLAYNVVWDNGKDYVGTARPASDLAASPALLDLGGRFALLPDSPCIGAGPAWTSIGSGEDASALTTLSFDLAPELDGWLGATWTSTLRLGGFPVVLETLGIGGHWVG